MVSAEVSGGCGITARQAARDGSRAGPETCSDVHDGTEQQLAMHMLLQRRAGDRCTVPHRACMMHCSAAPFLVPGRQPIMRTSIANNDFVCDAAPLARVSV